MLNETFYCHFQTSWIFMVESIKLLFFYRTIWSSNPDRWAKHVKTNFWRPRFCLTAGAVVTLYVTIYMIACDVVVQCSLNWRPWGWDGGGLRCSRIRRRPITIAATLKFETVEKKPEVISTFLTYHSGGYSFWLCRHEFSWSQWLKIISKVSFWEKE